MCISTIEKKKHDRYLNLTFKFKCKVWLIVKLRAIKSREDTFCDLTFYLYYSFFCQLGI